MKRTIIFGNSAAGKSTLAQEISLAESLPHFDLDLVAWQATTPPARKPLLESKQEINDFVSANEDWVIEGCYADLLEIVMPLASDLIFLNLHIETCINNAKNRQWEPHKYESKQAQDANLEMLLDWIAQYDQRKDTFSRSAHQTLFDRYDGEKTMYVTNDHKPATLNDD